MKNKYKYLKLLVVFIIIIFIVIININIYFNNKENHLYELKFNNENLDFKGRKVYLKNNELSIGNNLKELENGYYDFKIKIINNKEFELYFNKLFKNFNEEILYDDNYINEILIYLNKVINLNLDNYILKDIIVENYSKIRENKINIELNKEYKISDRINLKAINYNNILKLEVRIFYE